MLQPDRLAELLIHHHLNTGDEPGSMLGQIHSGLSGHRFAHLVRMLTLLVQDHPQDLPPYATG